VKIGDSRGLCHEASKSTQPNATPRKYGQTIMPSKIFHQTSPA